MLDCAVNQVNKSFDFFSFAFAFSSGPLDPKLVTPLAGKVKTRSLSANIAMSTGPGAGENYTHAKQIWAQFSFGRNI